MQVPYAVMESLFPVSRSDRALEHNIDLQLNEFLSNIAHAEATVIHLDAAVVELPNIETPRPKLGHRDRKVAKQYFTLMARSFRRLCV
jgi:hypothetical protein